MKNKHIWLSTISLLLGLWMFGQTEEVPPSISITPTIEETAEKPIKTFALRVGLDIMKPILTQLNSSFQGLELVGDLRLNRRIFIAAEIGSEKKTQQSELINFSTSGSYIKLGVDYNFFNNWKGMNNALYVGLRFARSLHTHTVNSYELYQLNQYLMETTTSGYLVGEREQLSNGWMELIFGTKVQLLPNLYAGISARLHILLTNPQPENFGNLYAPGFNKITDENSFGASFNYTVSYSFPFRFKKGKN